MNLIRRIIRFNSSRYRLHKENAEFAAAVPADAIVLDAGAGHGPYKALFSHATYESADFEMVDKTYAPATYVCDLASIPVKDQRFDFIVFNQVLEHLPEPGKVLCELHRVLKPGGRMIYSGPLFFEEHEQPYDFYRYTQFGLRHLFDAAGFKVERLDWLEGYFGTVAYQFSCMARFLPLRPKDMGGFPVGFFLAPFMLLLRVVCAGCAMAFHVLETRVKFTSLGHPKNYVAIVIRPTSETPEPAASAPAE